MLGKSAFGNGIWLLAAVVAILSFGGFSAYAQNVYLGTGSNISILDPASGVVTSTIPVNAVVYSYRVSADGSRLYFAGNGGLSILDTASQKIVGTFAGITGPVSGLSPDGTRVYSLGYTATPPAGYKLSVLDTTTNSVIDSFSINAGPLGPSNMALTPDGSRIYLANFGSVVVIDPISHAITNTIAGFNSATAIGLTPDGKKAYVANNLVGTVSVIDTITNTITSTISVGTNPDFVVPSPDSSKVYVAAQTSGSQGDAVIVVIDTATDKVKTQIPMRQITGLAFTPDGTKAYAQLLTENNQVVVIDAVTDTISSSISIYGGVNGAQGNFIGPAPSPLVSAVLPGARSVQVANTATVFATMINTSARPLSNCKVGLLYPSDAGLSLSYQTTNSSTNAPIGLANTPAPIPPGGSQTFVLAFSATATTSGSSLPLSFGCDLVSGAPNFRGLNTIDLNFSSAPSADIVALSATASGDGVLTVPLYGTGAFAVSSINVGASSPLTTSVDFGSATLPLTATVCQSDPVTAQCISSAESSVPVAIATNQAPTFSVFAKSTGSVAFAPATARVFVRFKDANGIAHGSTSVAVKTTP